MFLPLFITFLCYILTPFFCMITARKFFPITFIGSILWIAGFSYLMVWWATISGKTFTIPPEVKIGFEICFRKISLHPSLSVQYSFKEGSKHNQKRIFIVGDGADILGSRNIYTRFDYKRHCSKKRIWGYGRFFICWL